MFSISIGNVINYIKDIVQKIYYIVNSNKYKHLRLR